MTIFKFIYKEIFKGKLNEDNFWFYLLYKSPKNLKLWLGKLIL